MLFRTHLNELNPVLFKRIHDICAQSEYRLTWTLEQMENFFLNATYYLDLEHFTRQDRARPSIDQLVALFETLDKDKDGFLTQEDMRAFFLMHNKLKTVNFDISKLAELLSQLTGDDQEDAELFAQGGTDTGEALLVDIRKLLLEFDVVGDDQITVEEFFNIVMAFYD